MNTPVLTDYRNYHAGRWYEIVVYCKDADDDGEIVAKFISGNSAYLYAKMLVETKMYTQVIVR